MPTGTKGIMNITDMTEAELEKEFREEKEEEEDGLPLDAEEEEAAIGERSHDSDSRTPSTDRPSSSDSVKTTSANSDLHSEEPGGSGDRSAMEDKGEKKRKKHGPAVWQSFKKVGGEFNQDARRVFRYFGRKLHSRHGQRETKVKEIHIPPGEEDDRMWARRMAGSGLSRSSSGSDPTT